MAKKRRIGKMWTKRFRKVNGKRRLVKVRKRGKKQQIRILGVKNLTDSSARKRGRHRKKGYYSSTDHGHIKHRV